MLINNASCIHKIYLKMVTKLSIFAIKLVLYISSLNPYNQSGRHWTPLNVASPCSPDSLLSYDVLLKGPTSSHCKTQSGESLTVNCIIFPLFNVFVILTPLVLVRFRWEKHVCSQQNEHRAAPFTRQFQDVIQK